MGVGAADLALLLAHAAAAVFMSGVIWIVQVVHYPLFARVGNEGFAAYEAAHTRRIRWVVGPAMLAEAALALALLIARLPGIALGWLVAGLVGIVAVWAATALLAVPRHTRLTAGFDATDHASLVATNWIRTVAWSARGGLALWLVWLAVRGART